VIGRRLWLSLCGRRVAATEFAIAERRIVEIVAGFILTAVAANVVLSYWSQQRVSAA
jgi:hypothetical protein